MIKTTQTEIVRRFVDEVWNRGKSEAIASFTAPEFIDRAYDPRNSEGHRNAVEALKSIIPDALWTIDSLAAAGNVVIAELTMRGTHRAMFRGVAPQGNAVEVRCYRTFVFSGELLVEHSALLDTDRLLKQMAETKTD